MKKSLGNAASSSAGRAYLLSLGCPKNEVDAQIIAALLGKNNWCLQDTPLGAELIIINTCAFIQEAKEESIAAILEAGKEKQSGSCRWLVVTGCFSQRYGVNLPTLLPEVDLFLGVNDIPHLGEHISSLVAGASGNEQKMDTPTFLMSARQSRMLSGQRHVAYLKIADGCNNHCSYCAIPQIRGVYRSRTIADTLLEAQELVRMGVKEVILAAQDTTLFGKDRRGAQEDIGTLLRALARIEGVRWLRLLYTHPAHIDEELLAAIAQEAKVCKYIDLPIQHINDQILQSMNRRVTKKEIIAVLEKIRQAIPQVALRTSIIVGYPLETPKRFAELLAFVEAARFEHLGVFCYSREEDTPAFKLGNRVSQQEKEERRGMVMEAQAQISLAHNQGLVGSLQEIIIDELQDETGATLGRIGRQAHEIDGITRLHHQSALHAGDFVLGRVEQATEYDLTASLVAKR